MKIIENEKKRAPLLVADLPGYGFAKLSQNKKNFLSFIYIVYNIYIK